MHLGNFLLCISLLFLVGCYLRWFRDMGKWSPWFSFSSSFSLNRSSSTSEPTRSSSSSSFFSSTPRRLKMVHITDLHLDPYYDPFASPDHLCHSTYHPAEKKNGRPSVLSQETKPRVNNSPFEFGHRGTLCDSPQALISLVVDFLSTNEIHGVLWTGDSARHDRDPNLPRTKEEVLAQNEECVHQLKWAQQQHQARFNSSFLVFPTLGNLGKQPLSLSLSPLPFFFFFFFLVHFILIF
ncbi:Endopolyphosphatase [Coelomomyces lativittatus]|nr:Endopolyphosphatase [Coelomomyces lativittatus]